MALYLPPPNRPKASAVLVKHGLVPDTFAPPHIPHPGFELDPIGAHNTQPVYRLGDARQG